MAKVQREFGLGFSLLTQRTCAVSHFVVNDDKKSLIPSPIVLSLSGTCFTLTKSTWQAQHHCKIVSIKTTLSLTWQIVPVCMYIHKISANLIYYDVSIIDIQHFTLTCTYNNTLTCCL